MCDHCGCREYPPIAELTAEHEAILALAEPLADAIRHQRPVDEPGRARLVELLDLHVTKEEAGLYPLLIAVTGDAADAFAHLEAEHAELFAALEQRSFDHLALYALQRHIEEEEEVLFNAALFRFDGDAWDDLESAHRHVEQALTVVSRGM
ncbi:MAG TPA: hemerythrin domain-containing protein [Acidimicrobiales bacterium]|nr:hemerythrin domain-containing protein [Acidimicrobiales bacterium]